jgi:hypothetical protein
MAERSEVESGDGGSIAVWVEGDGPPLVLVHGLGERPHGVRAAGGRAARRVHNLRDGPTWLRLHSGRPRLLRRARVQRRFGGRGRSRSADRGAGGAIRQFLGPASCALGAAPDLPSLRALVLYEPNLGLRYPSGSIDRMEERVAAGDNEGAIVEMATQIAGLTEDEIAERRAAPNWPERVALAPTIGSRRGELGLADQSLRRHRRTHTAHHRIRNHARACGGHDLDRRSNPRRASSRPRRPGPRRPCI